MDTYRNKTSPTASGLIVFSMSASLGYTSLDPSDVRRVSLVLPSQPDRYFYFVLRGLHHEEKMCLVEGRRI